MTPERREELRRADDAIRTVRYTLDRKNYLVAMAAQEERIKALESLLAKLGIKFISLKHTHKTNAYDEIIAEIDTILPATEVSE